MRWSQLRKQVKERIATSLADSIDVNQTRYRHAHDQEGEFWITFGSDRIFSAGSVSYLSTLSKLAKENGNTGATLSQAYGQAWSVMKASDMMLLEELNKDLFESLSLAVEDMLAHGNPVIRALAVVDARYGKRRLTAFDPVNEHPLVRHLFHLRCEAEGIAHAKPALN